MSDGVLLPDGFVLVLGGSGMGKADDNDDPVLDSELFDSGSEKWASAASQQVPRRYHSVALLLPDGRVLSAGSTGNWPHAPWPFDDRHPPVRPDYRVEIYSPPYLFRGKRPVIAASPPSIHYDQVFDLEGARRTRVESVVLMRPSAVTHTNDMDQRLIRLSIERQSGRRVNVRAPHDGTWAPPGWYMLFALNAERVPSVARFTHLS
jgi:hypothetical protein